MKRLWWWVLPPIALAAALIWMTSSPTDSTLWIGTIPETRSLLLAPDESLDVLVYFSKPKSFFVDENLVLDVSIADDLTTASMKLLGIEYVATEAFHERTYAAYRFQLGFEAGFETGFELGWSDAVLTIQYVEDVELSLPIGTLSVRIGSIAETTPLSLMRLYGRKGDGCGIERVLIGLTNVSSFPIRIARWENGISSMSVHLERWSSNHPSSSVADLSRFGESWTEEDFWLPGGETRYLVLRIEETEDLDCVRFYLRATWEGAGLVDLFLVDDFRYVTEGGGMCDGKILREVEFRYPT